MREQPVNFDSDGLTLEGLYAPPANPGARGCVVCHPHPLYGGTMYNNVVDAALAAMWSKGWATLRFNFRGVGQSEGEHDGGRGEANDAAAAIKWLTAQASVAAKGAVLGGYSFGAMAAAAAAPKIPDLAALVLIALPIGMMEPAGLDRFGGAVMLVAGDQDGYCPASKLKALHERLGARGQMRIVAGADHFFGGFEPELQSEIEAMLAAL